MVYEIQNVRVSIENVSSISKKKRKCMSSLLAKTRNSKKFTIPQ